MKTKGRSFAELAYELFPEELTEFYEKNISLYALFRKIRKVNESMAFDIWRYLLVRADAKQNQRRLDHGLVDAYEFHFEESLEAMYLSALQRDEQFREVMFRKTIGINERQVWLLYLALKYEDAEVFDACMRLYRRNFNRFRRSSSYRLDYLLLRVIDRLLGRAGASYMTLENYHRILYFVNMIALPQKRRYVRNMAKRALEFTTTQALDEETRRQVVQERTLKKARQTEDSRIRERDVKYPLWEDGHTIVPYRIAGLKYYLSPEEAEERLPVGTLLQLAYERENKFDYIAVSVSLTDGTKVGYIGKPYNRAFCDLICQGENIFAVVSELERDVTGFVTVWITVFRENL